MYLHKTKNGHYTPPCCYFSGELEVVEILRAGLCGKVGGIVANQEALADFMYDKGRVSVQGHGLFC